MRVLVTGAAGFFGVQLCNDLLVKGHYVVGVDNLFTGQNERIEVMRPQPNFVFVRSSATDCALLQNLVHEHNLDAILSLATVPLESSLVAPGFSSSEIWRLGLALAEVSRLIPELRIIHVSSSEVFGDCVGGILEESSPRRPKTPYASAKAAVDLLLHSYIESFGINATIFRPFNAFGPLQNKYDFSALIPRVARKISLGEDIVITGDGNQTRDFVSLNSISMALIALAEHPTQPIQREYNFGSGEEISVNTIVNWLLEIDGAQKSQIRYVEARSGDVMRHRGSHSLFLDEFGISPEPLSLAALQRLLKVEAP